MKIQKAKTALAWPWMIRGDGDDYADPGEILAKVKDEKLARQFAASDDMLAACEMWVAADKLMNELDPTAYNDACIEAHRATRAAIEKARGEK